MNFCILTGQNMNANKEPLMNIRTMTRDELQYLAALAGEEGWGNGVADYNRLYDFEPEGCFLAEIDGRPVGTITSIIYNHYAFLASLIVDRKERGKGIGEALMKIAMNYVQSKGVHSIELDGVIEATPLYRRLGFFDKYLSLRMHRPAREFKNNPREIKPGAVAIDDIIKFDARITGLDRGRVIKRLHDEFPDGIINVGYETLDGYAAVRPRADGSYFVGPILALDSSGFVKLLEMILDKYSQSGLLIGTPELNQEAVEILLNNGFHYRQPSLRMFFGQRLDYEGGIFGIISPEKG